MDHVGFGLCQGQRQQNAPLAHNNSITLCSGVPL